MIRPVRLCPPVLVIALLSAGACGDPLGNQSPADLPLPAPVGPGGFSTEMDPFQPGMQWGAGGRTIYAINRGFSGLPHGIVAVDTHTKQVRTVVAAENASIAVLRISSDGASLFYSSLPVRTPGDPTNEGYSIFRVPTTGTGPEEMVRGASHVFATSPDGRMLAWRSHTSDSIFIRDLATGQTRHAASGFPLSVSPDYSLLLHSELPTLSVTATAVATGSGTTAQGRLEDARWGAAGAELLFWGSGGRVMVQRGIAEPRETLWSVGPGSFFNVSSATWSADGLHVAAAVAPGCIRAPCRHQLVLIDVATGTSRTLVDSSIHGLLGKPIFSGDGRNLAVTTAGHIHVISLP
jgi:hypothetical protein